MDIDAKKPPRCLVLEAFKTTTNETRAISHDFVIT